MHAHVLIYHLAFNLSDLQLKDLQIIKQFCKT